jgi:hypothetical protein
VNEPASNSSEDIVDQPPAPLPSVSANHLQSSGLVLGGAAILAGMLSWGILETCFPVFDATVTQIELSPSSSPKEVKAMEDADEAVRRARRHNTILAMAVFGFFAGTLFASSEAYSRRNWKWIPVFGAVGGLFGAAGGGVAAIVGLQMFNGLHRVTDLSPMAQTMVRQSAMLGILGLGVGMGAVISYRKLLLLLNSALGCVLGGLLVAIVYPPLIGFLVHNVRTEVVMPASGFFGLVWLTMTTGAMAWVVTGLGKQKTAKATEPTIACEGDGTPDS